MDTFDLFENFITPAEQTELIEWAMLVKEDCIERDNLHSGGRGRRLSDAVSRFEPLPNIVNEIERRIEQTLGVEDAQRLKYKIVIHEQGADTANHVDEYSDKYPDFFRAAVLIQDADEGGIFRVDNVPVTFPERSLLSFTGASSHGVTVVAQGERILLRANWYRN